MLLYKSWTSVHRGKYSRNLRAFTITAILTTRNVCLFLFHGSRVKGTCAGDTAVKCADSDVVY